MGILFLSLFTLAEIALVALTSTMCSEKAVWLKNRTIVRAAEAILLLGIILVPATHMKWRFFAAFGVVALRLIIAGVMWLSKRKTATGVRKTGRAVVSCVLSVMLVAVTLAPAFLFTNYNGLPASGEYEVKEASAILVDSSRTDPFESDGSFREVPAHFFYPENAEGAFPLVIFSHGAFGYYQSNYSTYAELVSNGYIVIALDHPHHAIFTTDTDGKTVTADMNFINEVMNADDNSDMEAAFSTSSEWLKIRMEDENFVLDTVKAAQNSKTLDNTWHTKDDDAVLDILKHTDMEKIGLIGHSLGGAASVSLGRERDDIDAVIDLDGTMLGERKAVENGKYVYYTEPYPIPVLDLINEKHYTMREPYLNEHGYSYVNEYVTENATDGITATFNGSEHMDFTDLPLFSPVLAANLGSNDIDHEKMMTTVNSIVLNWFNYYLKSEGALNIQAQY